MTRRCVLAIVVFTGVLSWGIEFPKEVTPLGLSEQKLSDAFNRLCAPPLDNPEFVLSDVDFTLKRRFTEYSGDVSGRMLGALGLADEVLRRNAPMVDELVKALPERQKADGHFGAPQDLDKAITQERDMPILWGNGRLLRAMAEEMRRNPDPRLREAAIKLGDYIIATRPYYGKKENFEDVGGLFASGFTTCYPSLIDGLVQLGISTGEQRFFDEARFIGTLSLTDTDFKDRHSHGRLTAYRGMLELDLATGTHEFIDAVEQGVADIAATYPFPTGGIPEKFDLDYDRDEGCSEGDWVWVHLLLWQATGKPQYLDIAENVVRNHVYATEFGNGGFGHHVFTKLALGDAVYRAGGIGPAASDSYWCCSMHDTQLLADLPSWAVVADGDHIRVTWLAEVRAQVVVKDVTVAVTAEEREPGTWTLTVAPEKPVEATLALRVPGWATAIRVDGAEQAGDAGWVNLSRTWDASTDLTVEFPMGLRTVPLKADTPTPVLAYSGADLLCLPDFGLHDDFLQPGHVPSVTVCADRLVDAHLPALVRNGDGVYQQALLGPMALRMPGGCRYVLDLSVVSADAFDPLWLDAQAPADPGVVLRTQFSYDGAYVVYLNGKQVLRHGGWQEAPTLEVQAENGDNFIAMAVPAATHHPGVIGVVRFGDAKLVTQAAGWRAYVFENEPTGEQLTASALSSRESAPIREIGELGAEPWGYIPGHFASTGAKWIWTDNVEAPKDAWLVFVLPFAVEAPA